MHERVRVIDANAARNAIPREKVPEDQDSIPAEEAFVALGVGRSIGYSLLSSGVLESFLSAGHRRVRIDALKTFRAEQRPLAIICETREGAELVRVAIVHSELGNMLEIAVTRDGVREAMCLPATSLMCWRRDLSGQRLRDALWRYGVQTDAREKPATRPRPLPGDLAKSTGGEDHEVSVRLVEIGGEKRVEIVRGYGASAERISFAPAHLQGWINTMGKSALVAWRAGALHDDSALINVNL